MPAKKTVVYDCDVCGTEVTVNSEGISNLSPIYCCGTPLTLRKNKPARKMGEKSIATKKVAKKRSPRTASGKASLRTAKKALGKKRIKR